MNEVVYSKSGSGRRTQALRAYSAHWHSLPDRACWHSMPNRTGWHNMPSRLRPLLSCGSTANVGSLPFSLPPCVIHVHVTRKATDSGATLSETPSEHGPLACNWRTYQPRVVVGIWSVWQRAVDSKVRRDSPQADQQVDILFWAQGHRPIREEGSVPQVPRLLPNLSAPRLEAGSVAILSLKYEPRRAMATTTTTTTIYNVDFQQCRFSIPAEGVLLW
jgi:hypothetical protein